MKLFLRYTLTLVAILIATSNAWAAKETWNGGVAVGAGKGSATVELYNDGTFSDTKEETAESTDSTVASFSKTEKTGIGNWTIDNRYMKFSATKAGGYEFAGWFSNSACTQSYSTDNPYQTSSNNKSLDLTLYAKFTPHTYTVTYNGNGATSGSMSSQTLVFDQTEKLNANQYERLYTITYINDDVRSTTTATATYTGWNTNANGTGTSYANQANMRNFLLSNNGGTLNLYAKWTLANITLPSPTKEGYILEGWYDSNGKVGNAGDEITPTSDMTLTAYWIQKFTPNLQGPSEITMQVADTTLADFIFENVSQDKPSENSGDFHFTITHSPDNTSKEGSPNRNLVISYDPSTNNIIALNSGTATITFIQEEIDTYYTDTLRSTITVSKQTSSFILNFAKEYYVDDEINNSTFLTNSTNSEVAIQVSDKTTDNRALFTYNGSVLKANGATLNADSETTTITVTQPENYKWTSYTQEKNVTVKKRQTNFAWNDGESLECYVDDKTDITNLYTKASDNTLPVNFNIEVIERGYGNTDVVTLENGVLKAIGEGKVVVTASQAVDRKWTDFSTPITINVKRYDVSATLNPTTTVWNATHSNPFSVSISPANGETITDFIVGESSNSTVATYNASSKTIQTYYTSGSANFLITRDADRKYNALNQTLTLTVNANWGCNLIENQSAEANYNFGNTSATYSTEFSLNNGIGTTLMFNYKLTEGASYNHYLTPQYSLKENGDNFYDIPNSTQTTQSTTPNSVTITLPDSTKRIRFKRTSEWLGTKSFSISNITVTRAQYIRPTDGERALSSTDTLKLPTVAIGQPSSQPFNLKWSACTDIKIVWNNPKFSISTTDITARDGSLPITVSCNTSEIGTFTDNVIIYNQEQMETFPISCKVYTKWITDSISGSTTHSMKVDESWDTDFYFPIQRASQYPTTVGAFHYAIINQTFVDADPADRNPNHPNDVISYNNGVITAHNAGTAILTIKHEETDEHFASEQFTCTLTVSKHDAKLQWKDPVYYNDTISNYFTTTDTISTISIVSQTDTAVAKLTNEFNPTSNNSLDLITFNKEDSTIVTVSQEENYKWNGYFKKHTIRPIDPSNHVTFTLTEDNYINVFQETFSDPWAGTNGPNWSNGGIRFGQGGIGAGDGGYNWNDKYIIIEFTGIPDSLSFTTTATQPWLDMGGSTTGPNSNLFFYVSEGISATNWTNTWEYTERDNNVKEKLDPDTRFLKLCFTGNLEGWFKDVKVTELNEFRAVDSQQKTLDKDTLDFGANQVYTNKTRTFDLRYANPGYKISVESTDSHFTVTPDSIGNIGGEHHGTLPITVSYTSTEKYAVSGDAMIIIKDEIGHADTVRLYASSDKAQQVLHWCDDFEAILKPIIRIKNGNITDAAWATSKLPVTLTSSDENVIKISADSTTLIPVAVGEAEITAYQKGNEMWLPATPITKTFIVTDKLLQYIIWDDDFTNIIKEDIDLQTLPLTAKVYLQQENDTAVFSQEQTDSLVYKSANDSIVSASGTTLTVHNIGKTTLTVSVDGNDDYAPASLTKPVIVRSPALGCEDDLLYHHEGDPIQFFQMNLDEVISKTLELDLTKGIPGYVNVAHEGKSWDLVIQYYAAEIRVEQSLDNGTSWNTAGTIKPERDKENLDSIPLSRQATHIRFVRNAGGQGYQFLNTIDVHPAQYIEARDINSPHEKRTVVPFGEIHVGSSETRTFLLDYSNIKHSLSPVPSTPEVTATPSSFSDCNGFGRQEISVTWLPTEVNDNATATVTFTDPNSGMEKVVTLTAKIIKGKQFVVWDDQPATIEDCGTITFPKYTTAHLPITWTVTQGKEYADFNEQGMLEIYKNGTIIVQATQEGTANYEPLTPVSFTFDIQLNITFVGTEDTDWNNPNNWAMCRLPLTEEVVTIAAPAELSTHDTIKGVIFDSNTPGSIHITHTGGLTINEAGVTNAATDGSSITIDNNPQGAGFLLISPSAPEDNKHPYFTMDFTTRAFNEGVPRDETWQYMGAPGNNATFKDLNSQTLIYHWDETKGWTPYTVTDTIPTWQGYALTQSIQANHTYQITAQAIQGTKTIDLTYTASGMKGDNLFVNSYTAPIDITKIDTNDISVNWGYKTFYFFNTGSWNDWQGTNPNHSHDDASSAGHYYAVPLFSAPYLEGSQTIVPPMQGVYVHTEEAPVSITLNYEKHVWNGTAGNLPMRAPQKQSPDFRRVRIQVSSDNSGADRMYIIQEPSTTRDYDNGYDGKNINAKGQVNIYTNEPFGKMEVSCANNIDSMYIGLRTGSDTHYTLTFGAIAGDSLYLQDLENDSIIPIFDDEQYHFTAGPNAVNNNRFLLLSRPYKAPNGETSTPETDGDELTKIWSVGKVIYIANAPANSVATLYTVGGHLVLSTPIANSLSPAILDVSYLPEGIYILRLNDQVYKFVCK